MSPFQPVESRLLEGKGEKEIKATILENIDGKFILDFKAVQFYSVQDCLKSPSFSKSNIKSVHH